MIKARESTTPFYRLDALAGWRQSTVSESILQDPVMKQLRLGKPGDFPIPPDEPFGTFGGMTLPRGVTINADGQLLLADPGNDRILYFDNGPCGKESRPDDKEGIPAPFRALWSADGAGDDADAADPARQHEVFGDADQPRDFYDLRDP